MNHLESRTLETDRLILRAFVPEDAEPMYRNWAGDPEVTKYLTWPTHRSQDETAQVIGHWVEQYNTSGRYLWAIVWKETMKPIGSISVVDANEAIDQVHIGYCIGKPWWHRGVMTECFSAVIRFMFEEVGVNRIEAAHDVNNPRSGMVMTKCGLRCEGIHRQAGKNNQGICDMKIYAILRQDYEAEKQKAL